MLRDFKFVRRNPKGNEETENVPIDPKDQLFGSKADTDVSSRAPLNAIHDPANLEQEVAVVSRAERTPTKSKGKSSDLGLPHRTPEKYGNSFSSRNRFGWGQKGEVSLGGESGFGNGGLPIMTPRSVRAFGRANSGYSECNSTQSTPTKSISKPPNPRSKIEAGNGIVRTTNFASLYKGISTLGVPSTIVNTVEVPHFDLKEDPSFWMDHNVQVLIRVRPLNSMEKSIHGYNRCLKQESAQTITWLGQPETRFTFDHVACETIDQETLFRMAGLPMVENCLSGYNSCMFAYGQTGSGKTHTMLGEIEDLEVKSSPNRGMTPRIFEFLFARIRAEEESRSDEKLKYNCKCSFLEIYNEQITDLLDPSSTNLLLREDMKKGVYVENLSEFEVQTVSDILTLLSQGSSNRKVAVTNMNRESSRSHCVFTCVIESQWEKDSTTNLRFARLNLVDLAGSERQKASGAEGERLKEAASINKSLSTLGHVIMVLLDVAHGKPKHVPYRDSRLTFLLQDSLGGNSKTMIIANVSPSICCAAETLNTLKFAQRAKLIQNNAVVNEDTSGDVTALQNQIELLKKELSALRHHNVSRTLSFGSSMTQDNIQMLEITSEKKVTEDPLCVDDALESGSIGTVRMSSKQFKSLETTLAGALRREQMAEVSIKQLEAEIEQLNRLVRQREEDTRSTKMMLRFREEKIRRMESLVSSSIPIDSYLHQENTALSEEIQLLQAKLERNPEVTRFALENIRLLDQIRRFQDFYEEGEREMLLAEVSELRNQLLEYLDSNLMTLSHSAVRTPHQESIIITRGTDSFQLELKHTLNELEDCRTNLSSCLEENEKLSREIQDLRAFLNEHELTDMEQDVQKIHLLKEIRKVELRTATVNQTEEIVNLQLELDILKVMLKEEKMARSEVENKAISLLGYLESEEKKLLLMEKQCADAKDELKNSKSIVEALESQQILLIHEAEDLRNNCKDYVELLANKELEILSFKERLSSQQSLAQPSPMHLESEDSHLQTKLKKMQGSLEKAKRLNTWYQSDRAYKTSSEEEMDEVRRQAEAETAEVIVCMQEELAILQQQVDESTSKETETMMQMKILKTELKDLQEKLYIVTQDCEVLHEKLRHKDGELNMLTEEWEKLICEIEEALSAGHEAIIEAADQLDHISISFPQKRTWISGQVGNMLKSISEKELVIEELTQCLVDANNKRSDLECMLSSLRGATLVITEAHQNELSEKEKEILLLTSQLNAKTSTIEKLNNRIRQEEDHIRKSSLCAMVAFVIASRLSEVCHSHLNAVTEKDILLIESKELNLRNSALLNNQAVAIEESEKNIESLLKELEDSKKSCHDLQLMLSEEKDHAYAMEQKLKDIEIDYILKTTEKLAELKAGVSSVKSCMALHSAPLAKTDNESGQEAIMSSEKYVEQTDANHVTNEIDCRLLPDPIADICSSSVETHHSVSVHLPEKKSGTTCQKVFDRDNIIILLRKEIESALTSLKGVQAEMEKLRGENEEILLMQEQSCESIKFFKTQALSLQETMIALEKQSELKLISLDHKLQNVQKKVEDTCACWCQMKESDDLEIDEARMVAAEKSAEASYAIAKFEEVQDTMKEADIMMNGLMIANEAMKFEIDRLKNEKCALVNEVQNLQSLNDLKNVECENLEKQLKTDFIDSRNIVLELEGMVEALQSSLGESFKVLTLDFSSLKSQFLSSTRLLQIWLEDIWSEIILKDCALSVLHLCHMGILLEAVTGLNAENGLLQHNLCESESLITNLRDHNLKSIRDLEMCRNLEGKLLADIKTSFDRFSMKEKDTEVLNVKINNFEKRISDLQHQEELMLQRSNDIGSELAILWKELDSSNSTLLATLINQEKLLHDKEGYLISQADFFMVDLSSKELESLVLVSRLEEMSCHEADLEREKICCWALLDNLKKEVILLKVDGDLKEQIMKDSETAVSHLQKECEDSIRERKDLLSDLEESHLKIAERDQVIRVLEKDSHLLKDISCVNDTFKKEISEIRESKVRLLTKVQALEVEHEKLLEKLNMKETEVEVSNCHLADFHIKTQKLENEVCLLNASLRELQSESDMKSEAIVKIAEENESLKTELRKLESEHGAVFQDLDAKKSVHDSTLSRLNILDMENHKLQDSILSMECTIALLQSNIDRKNSELEILVNKENKSSEDNAFLRSKLMDHGKSKNDILNILSLNSMRWIDKLEMLVKMSTGMTLNQNSTTFINKMFEEVCQNSEMASKFVEELECLQYLAEDLSSENMHLQAELLRKGELEKGLLFDLRLLQESASNTKDQKDELQELTTSLEELKDQLATKTNELNEVLARELELENQLKEEMETISDLELSIGKEQESLKLLSSENTELRARIEDILASKFSIEEELLQREQVSEGLEMELQEMDNAFSQMNSSIDSLKSNLNDAVNDRDDLHSEVLILKEKLSMAKSQAEEYEAILAESQEIAESRKVYSEEKEEEVKLLERSIEELEYTINVLENKVEIIKEEAERQRLQREELELELQTIKHQMQNVESGDTDLKRCLEEKDKKLQEALKQIQILERDIGDRDSEIAQFREHILELNMQSEAQASEYKQRFKALEAMLEQVRLEGSSNSVVNTSANKLEKNSSKSRGSGSPFKCIGLGLAQQIKSERDEELTVGRARIEELEILAASRQKEIFLLNARLASAESMTHDVIRDLLGVKLDMTHYATLMHSQQVPEIIEKARFLNVESQEKNQEVVKLKQQLSEFIEERKGWLEEMDRKQAELVASQISLEQLHQRDQLLKAENDMLKMENANHKRKVIELEGEVDKLSGQQNLQQRIHHHAKVKEENNQLRIQNEALSTKLKRAETILARVKEELASYRASSGMRPYVNFDEEQRLQNKLTETEEEKLQLAQKLLNLCTSILKAARITRSTSDVNLPAAEEALQQLQNRISSLERELDASKLKDRINSEKARLSKLMPQLSPIETNSEDKSATPNRSSNVPFLSTLDR